MEMRILLMVLIALTFTACSFDPQPVKLTFEVKDSTVVMEGTGTNSGMDVLAWIDRVVAIITALGVVGGTAVALYGISSWRRQRRGEDAYKLAQNLRSELIYLRSEFSECRKYPAPRVRTREEINDPFGDNRNVVMWRFYSNHSTKISARIEIIRGLYYSMQPLGCGLDNGTMDSILWYMRQYVDQAGMMDQLRYDIDRGVLAIEELQPGDEALLNIYHSNYERGVGSDYGDLASRSFRIIFPNVQEIIEGTSLRKRIRTRLSRAARWIKENSQPPA